VALQTNWTFPVARRLWRKYGDFRLSLRNFRQRVTSRSYS